MYMFLFANQRRLFFGKEERAVKEKESVVSSILSITSSSVSFSILLIAGGRRLFLPFFMTMMSVCC